MGMKNVSITRCMDLSVTLKALQEFYEKKDSLIENIQGSSSTEAERFKVIEISLKLCFIFQNPKISSNNITFLLCSNYLKCYNAVQQQSSHRKFMLGVDFRYLNEMKSIGDISNKLYKSSSLSIRKRSILRHLQSLYLMERCLVLLKYQILFMDAFLLFSIISISTGFTAYSVITKNTGPNV